ncbi:MAG: hypothetical protein ACFWTJ_08090 [Lachnoclostridium sp.]|jgi:hypothetical protein
MDKNKYIDNLLTFLNIIEIKRNDILFGEGYTKLYRKEITDELLDDKHYL